MNPTNDTASQYHPLGHEARFALQLSRLLDEAVQRMPDGVEERLRVAREQAIARARTERQTATAVVPLGGGTLGWLGGGWRSRVAALLPILALVAGLMSIERQHRNDQISAAVEIDSALLTDDAPLAAYRDAGFVEFLKSPTN